MPIGMTKTVGVAAVAMAMALGAVTSAQGGRGQAPGGAAATPRAAAPIELTGTWVSVVTEDWRWRMVTPPKGDYPSVPLNAEGAKLAAAWDPARDTAAGEQCRAYGAGNIMRVPGRVRLSWDDDFTLKLEAEAGMQTRLFAFGPPPQAPAPPTWQGVSRAQWQMAGGRGRASLARGGQLTVVTTNLRPGYLQKNGVPYSEETRVTEYFNVTAEPNGDQWMVVTTVVEDPRYLTTRFARSSHFKKASDGVWTPRPCEAS